MNDLATHVQTKVDHLHWASDYLASICCAGIPKSELNLNPPKVAKVRALAATTLKTLTRSFNCFICAGQRVLGEAVNMSTSI